MSESKKDPRISSDADFVLSKKHEYSLTRLMQDYPDGVPDRIICKVLQITPEELQNHYRCAIINLKKSISDSGRI